MPTTTLRSLALTVQEHRAGEYRWSILERFEDDEPFEVLLAAEESCRTYGEALENGKSVLSALADGNMAIGPRVNVDDMPLFVETSRPGLYELVEDGVEQPTLPLRRPR
ncbi:hypothetical protein [Pseudorhodoferax sp. Leaf267]|uniref:hypothetical protein n=1 Tax=Pseudorhodoferax sp. Leaf267 TaxID=1736316 RepID=UPI000713CD82|nr:hypothetical protein [Pseudorhodoferax sp. Leaf267]KQP21789.1 hypothetical protein ASF43_26175 [Pseudorhodoferax sp. Leaf267]